MGRHHIFIIIFLFSFQQFCLADHQPDGYNLYKEWVLRQKAEETSDPVVTDDNLKMYFYRAPSLLLVPPWTDDQTMFSNTEKRTSNQYKNLKLAGPKPDEDEPTEPKENIFHFPRVMVRRKLLDDNNKQAVCWGVSVADCFAGWHKRGPGSIITWALSTKQAQDDNGFLSSLLKTDSKQLHRMIGSGRQSAFFATMGKRSDTKD